MVARVVLMCGNEEEIGNLWRQEYEEIIIFLIVIIIAVNISACGRNAKDVNVVDVESEIYSSDDIN